MKRADYFLDGMFVALTATFLLVTILAGAAWGGWCAAFALAVSRAVEHASRPVAHR